MSTARLLTACFVTAFAVACGPIEDPTTPELGEQQAEQVSGGVGWSVFHFKVDGVRVGSVLVTDGAYGGSYANQVEYWLWDPINGDDLRDGDVQNLVIDVAVNEAEWSDSLVASEFEAGTTNWIAWAIPRDFELQSDAEYIWSNTSSERFVYAIEAPAWGNEVGTIRYYLELDFHPSSYIPSMEWYVDADDIKTYYYSEDSDEDDDEGEGEEGHWDEFNLPPEAYDDAQRWEVRLTQDASAQKISWAYGYQLETQYPAN